MLKTWIQQTLLGGAIAMAAAVGCTGTAQAAVYTGHWDPAYGAPFPDLGWEGSASFFIPDACLSGSGWVENVDSCSGGAMKVLSAQVNFYNLASPSTIVETLTFDPSATVYQMYVDGSGELTAVSTAFLGPAHATSSIAGGGAYYFDLKFNESLTQNVALFHTLGYADPICAYTGGAGCGLSSASPTITLTAVVPEPGTFVLSLLGLTGFAVMRRRGN